MSLFRFNSDGNSTQDAKHFASSFCPAKTQSNNTSYNNANIADVVVSASVFVLSAISALVIIGGLVALNIISIIGIIFISLIFIIIKDKKTQNQGVFSLTA